MTKVVNLTAHPVVVLDHEDVPLANFKPSGSVARLVEEATVGEPLHLDIGNIPMRMVRYGHVDGLPEPDTSTVYIVSLVTAMTATDRNDVICPHGEVRDHNGRIIGVRGFARIEHHQGADYAD